MKLTEEEKYKSIVLTIAKNLEKITNKKVLYKGSVEEVSGSILEQFELIYRDYKAMEARVALFMELCTDNLSKTNYTLDAIREMVADNKSKEYDLIREEILEELGL